MTIWSPRLQKSPDPIYARIADALERDVRSGVLVAGSQLPTHRDLARELGITPVTVTRAYSEAARRGLVESSIGRGTFVRSLRTNGATSRDIDLATNAVTIPLPPLSTPLLERAAATLGTNYAIGPGSDRHRAAGAAWIGRRTDPARVVVTAGTQHALLLALAATTRPGDPLFCEAVTYHGAKAVAALLNLRLVPLPLDKDGLRVDAFERAARARTAKVLYTIPTLHNPTGSVMSEKRRRELAAIADKYGIAIIEDDVCGFLVEKTPPPIAAFAPDRTLFITGLGKAVAPALRVGYLAAPEAYLPRVHAALAASVLFSSPLVAEIAASWIEDGTAMRIVKQKRAEASLRNRIARAILQTASDPRSSHLWIELPRRWSPDAFAEEARRRRIRVASASSFAAGADVPRAIRVSVGAPATVGELETALHTIMGIEEERAQEPVV